MSSRRTTTQEREQDNPLQFFRTPPWATWALITWQQRRLAGARVLELGSGDGCIAGEVLACKALKLKRYVGVELDPKRADLCARVTGAACTVQANVLTVTPKEIGFFDVVVMNPPFDNAHLFLLAAKKFLDPGGYIFMLQRCTYPGESSTDRDELFKRNNPVGIGLGFFAELTLTNRVDFMGDGKADSVNHSWFAFRPGWPFPVDQLATREHVRRASCPWEPGRDAELPRQSWDKKGAQQSLL